MQEEDQIKVHFEVRDTGADLHSFEISNYFIVQIDGEIYEDLPFDVTLIHDVLRFYRP